MAGERFFQGIYYDNLGISYSAGTLTIHGANGRDLSSANPAVVVLPSKANPGQFTRYNITANQSFEDANGTSDITGALFGYTTSVAITVNVPFFIYAVTNDNEDAIAFMIGRVQHLSTSPASSLIGTPGSATAASTQGSLFSIASITATSYDSNPCVCIGAFTMQMDASDDWKVQTLGNTDGFGQYKVGQKFSLPLGQFGANSGTATVANGAVTTPVFTGTTVRYWFVSPRGQLLHAEYFLDNDGGTDGSGAVTAQVIAPFVLNIFASAMGNGRVVTPTYDENVLPVRATSPNNAIFFRRPTGTIVQWGDFTNGTRRIDFNFTGEIF